MKTKLFILIILASVVWGQNKDTVLIKWYQIKGLTEIKEGSYDGIYWFKTNDPSIKFYRTIYVDTLTIKNTIDSSKYITWSEQKPTTATRYYADYCIEFTYFTVGTWVPATMPPGEPHYPAKIRVYKIYRGSKVLIGREFDGIYTHTECFENKPEDLIKKAHSLEGSPTKMDTIKFTEPTTMTFDYDNGEKQFAKQLLSLIKEYRSQCDSAKKEVKEIYANDILKGFDINVRDMQIEVEKRNPTFDGFIQWLERRGK